MKAFFLVLLAIVAAFLIFTLGFLAPGSKTVTSSGSVASKDSSSRIDSKSPRTPDKGSFRECGIEEVEISQRGREKRDWPRRSVREEGGVAGNTTLYVPVAFHIVRRSNGTGGLNSYPLCESIAQLNQMFSGASIQFFQTGSVDWINNDAYYNSLEHPEEEDLLETNPVPNAVNVYLTPGLEDYTNANGQIRHLSGLSFYSWTNPNGVIVDPEYLAPDNTISHEMGHYFDLYHTFNCYHACHGPGCYDPDCNYAELVTRGPGANCASAGDFFCDTPADPRESASMTCNYSGDEEDANGDPYDPDESNLMSYFWNCTDWHFSSGQLNFMRESLLNNREELIHSSPSLFTDCDNSGTPDCEEISYCDDNHNGLLDSCERPSLQVPSQFPTIQAAINAASNCDVILVASGNYSGNGFRNIDFLGKTLILRSENGPAQCTLDIQEQGRAFNFSSCVPGQGRATIDGFTIRNGRANFLNVYGGAVSIGANCTPMIRNCIFEENQATGPGGAVMIVPSAQPVFWNCIFRNNTAGQGGAIYSDSQNFRFERCLFENNLALQQGGAVYLFAEDDQTSANESFINCVFDSNRAEGGSGGACYIRSHRPKFDHCTFYGNLANGEGRALAYESQSASQWRLRNSILWNGGQEIRFINNQNDLNLEYCTIQAWSSNFGTAVSSTDPQFINSAGRNFGLRPNSPSRDTAHPLYFENQDFDGNARVGDADRGAFETPLVYANDCGGWGNGSANYPFCKIQDAINAATKGTCIVLKDGNYQGVGNQSISIPDNTKERISLISEHGPALCTIDCQNLGPAFLLDRKANSVYFEGITIRDGMAATPAQPSTPTLGGAINLWQSSPTFKNMVFYSNEADWGGGAFLFQSDPVFLNCVFRQNTGQSLGGAFACLYSDPKFINCTFFGNDVSASFSQEGRALSLTASNPEITNCILWNGGSGLEIDILHPASQSNPIIRFSNIQGGGFLGQGNINTTPLFVSPATGNFALRTGSGCIDSGTAMSGLADDIEGTPRPQGAQFDIGAYEGSQAMGNAAAYPAGPNLWVDVNGSGDFTDIQSAINYASPGDIIGVVQGTYSVCPTEQSHLGVVVWSGKNLKIWGGYPTAGMARDPNLYAATIIDGSNSRRCLYSTGLSNESEISGFTFKRGNLAGGQGGAIFLNGSDLKFSDCQILDSMAGQGGGMYVGVGNPTLTRCRFVNNQADSFGGGLYSSYAELSLLECEFLTNRTTTAIVGNGRGGALHLQGGDAEIMNCRFLGNISNGPGGAIFQSAAQISLSNSLLALNQTSGSALHLCWGAGIAADGGSLSIRNCSLLQNVANASQGGAIALKNLSATLDSSIVWGNQAAWGMQIALLSEGTSLSVRYSDCENLQAGCYNVPFSTLQFLVGNIDLNPQLEANYRLLQNSPCINAGNPNYVPTSGETDLFGESRVVGGRIDMGADERN